MEDLKKALWEATKEPLRLLVLAIIPVILTWLTDSDWQYAGIIILILRFIDKFLYSFEKLSAERRGNEIEGYKGLTGF